MLGADNQQERPKLSIDFLAGLIVGEGSYALAIVRTNRSLHLRPMFSMRMNDEETIALAHQSFEALGLHMYRTPGYYQRCVQLTTGGVARMREHLDVFLPYLTGKKLNAALIVSEYCDRRIAVGKQPYDEDDLTFITRLREINGPSARRLDLGILRDYMREVSQNREAKR